MNEEIKKRRINLRSNASVGKSFGHLYDADLTKATGKVLTVAQVSRMMGVTKMTIHNYRVQRHLPYYTIEGVARQTIRLDEGLVLDWLTFNHKKVINEDYRQY